MAELTLIERVRVECSSCESLREFLIRERSRAVSMLLMKQSHEEDLAYKGAIKVYDMLLSILTLSNSNDNV